MTTNRAQDLQGDRSTKRMLVVAAVVALWMASVGGRLVYLQLIKHSEYLKRAQNQQQRTIEINPKRGAIYDRNMHPLAMSMPVDSAYAMPREMKDLSLAAKLLAGPLEISQSELEEKLGASRTFVWLERKLTPEQTDAVGALNLKGVYLQKENQRFYPKRDLAAHVLGFVNIDEKGMGGIEYQLDDEIRGQSGKIVVMEDGRQRDFDQASKQGRAGASVVLTLDEKIQYIAERELSAAIAKTHAKAGSVVVLNPNNGEILAMANWPKFNPNLGTDAAPESRVNRAVGALYEPGSTFKLITLAAAFDQNLIRPDQVFDCEMGKIRWFGRLIHDHKPFGALTVSEILAQSSDVGAIKIALLLGNSRFYDYIRDFGFGSVTGVDMPGESHGLLRKVESWNPSSIGSISMGQEVGVTPLQLASAVSAIANGGLLYRPHIVSELRRGDSAAAITVSSQPTPKRVIRPETAATLRKLMEGVILGGTGKLARLDGWTAAGKTGSAQKIDPNTGRYSPTQLIASFSGFAPINDPAVTILVSLDSPVGPHEGGMVAAPVFKRIAEQVLPYLDVPRDVPTSSRLVTASYQPRAETISDLEDFTPSDSSPSQDGADVNERAAMETKASQSASSTPMVTAAVDEGGDIAVPNFAGKTVREVSNLCLKLGLDPVLIGSGVAMHQSPLADAKARHAAKVTVQFGWPPGKRAGSAAARP